MIHKSSHHVDFIDFWIAFCIEVDAKFDPKVEVDVVMICNSTYYIEFYIMCQKSDGFCVEENGENSKWEKEKNFENSRDENHVSVSRGRVELEKAPEKSVL